MTEHLQTQSVSGVDMLANKDPKLLLSIFLYKQWVTWILVCESGSFIARNSGSQVRFKNLLKHLFNFIILVFRSFCRWKDFEQRFCQFVGLEYSGVPQSSQEWTSQQAHLKFRPCSGQRNWLKKKPTIPSQAPQASVVKVQVSTIRRTQKRYGLLERAVRRMTLYSKKTMAAWLGLGKLHLKKPGDF